MKISDGETVTDQVVAAIGMVGENMAIPRATFFRADDRQTIGCFVHSAGALVTTSTNRSIFVSCVTDPCRCVGFQRKLQLGQVRCSSRHPTVRHECAVAQDRNAAGGAQPRAARGRTETYGGRIESGQEEDGEGRGRDSALVSRVFTRFRSHRFRVLLANERHRRRLYSLRVWRTERV